MNIFICVKQVPDTETKVVPNGDGTFIETSTVKWVMNPYDEFAVEESLKIKDVNSTVILVRVGSIQKDEALRTGMAMGADEAILVEAPDNLDSYSIAKALKAAIEKSGKSADLILTGKQAVDDDCMQVPQILAEMLGLPSVTVVSKMDKNDNGFTLKREVDGGAVEVYTAEMPLLVAVTKGINVPRYPSLPGIMKAKKKPFTQLSLSDVGVSDADRKIKYSNIHLPKEKAPGKKFDALDETKISSVVKNVSNLLKSEAKVL